MKVEWKADTREWLSYRVAAGGIQLDKGTECSSECYGKDCFLGLAKKGNLVEEYERQC
jgi:hypothetical protein